jgi:hypothetical protein
MKNKIRCFRQLLGRPVRKNSVLEGLREKLLGVIEEEPMDILASM